MAKRKNFGRFILIFGSLCFFLAQSAFSTPIRRAHLFPRALAMGGAYTAVGDSEASIAYNPAGLLIEDGEWSLHLPLLWLAYNDNVKKASEGKLNLSFNTLEEFNALLGLRFYTEVQLGNPFLYFPDWGSYFGMYENFWVELVLPDQPILPIVHIELVAQGIIEYAQAFEVKDGLFLGVNLKGIQRIGLIEDITLFRLISANSGGGITDTFQELNTEPAPAKFLPDIGILYRIKHPWKPRIGLSALNLGGADFGGAGEIKQFNSVGIAATPWREERGDITISLDYHDFSFSYFDHNSILHRIALGVEIATGRDRDTSRFMSFLAGIRSLQPSYGFIAHFGFLDLGLIQWTENFGTESTPSPDKRTMLYFNFRI